MNKKGIATIVIIISLLIGVGAGTFVSSAKHVNEQRMEQIEKDCK